MMPPSSHADARLQEIAELLAEAILRGRFRRKRKRNRREFSPENPLALSAASSAHVPSQDGERV